MTFASILSSIRRTKKQQAYSANDAYFEMIRSVSSGTEIDADEAATIIENAGKSEDDFEQDILTLAKHDSARKMLASAEKARQRSLALERLVEKLCVELDAISLPFREKIQAANLELRQCETIAQSAITAQRLLGENVLSDGAGQRKLEANAEIKKLLASRAEVLSRVPNPTRAKALQMEIDRRQKNLSEMTEGFSSKRRDYEQTQIDDAEFALSQHNSQTGQCDSELWEIANAIQDAQELAR